MSERQWVLLLSLMPGMGLQSLRRVLERQRVLRQTPEEVLGQTVESLRDDYGFNPKTLQAMKANFQHWQNETMRLDEHLSRCGVKWLTFQDAAYPSVLEQLEEPPPVLFGYGNWQLLEEQTFAVLASHDVSQAGLKAVEISVQAFLESGWTLVTSQNQKAYQQALLMALRSNKPHMMVLDRGLLEVFGDDLSREPVAAARIWRVQFDPYQDLALSPFRPRDKWMGPYGRVRDRLVATLAKALIAVEVRAGGFMEQLCLDALKRERSVHVCAHDLAQQEGNRRLIESGGVPIGGFA
jgi:DNA processing protein